MSDISMPGARQVAVDTARLYLRRLHAGDLDDYYQRIYADPDVMRTLLSRAPISRAEFDTPDIPHCLFYSDEYSAI